MKLNRNTIIFYIVVAALVTFLLFPEQIYNLVLSLRGYISSSLSSSEEDTVEENTDA